MTDLSKLKVKELKNILNDISYLGRSKLKVKSEMINAINNSQFWELKAFKDYGFPVNEFNKEKNISEYNKYMLVDTAYNYPFTNFPELNQDEAIFYVKASLMYKDRDQLSDAFLYGIEANNPEVIRLLLEDGRVDPSNDEGLAVRIAKWNGQDEIVNLLLSDPRVQRVNLDV